MCAELPQQQLLQQMQRTALADVAAFTRETGQHLRFFGGGRFYVCSYCGTSRLGFGVSPTLATQNTCQSLSALHCPKRPWYQMMLCMLASGNEKFRKC